MTVPTIVSDPRRLIALEAAHNVRDLGGYVIGDGRTIAWGRLLRGDGLHHLTPADLDALTPIGLRTVIDLRTPGEVDERGAFPIDRMPVELVHQPVIDTTWSRDDVPRFDAAANPEAEFLTFAYATMLAEGGDRFGAAIRRLAAPGALPAIFHCAAGKDRTGIMAALLLAGLGVDDDVIVADYGLTAAGIERMKAWLGRHHPGPRPADGRDALGVLRRPPRGDAADARRHPPRARLGGRATSATSASTPPCWPRWPTP